MPRTRSIAVPALLLLLLTGTLVDAGSLRARAPAADETAVQTAKPRLFAIRFRPGPGWDKSKAPGEQTGFASHSANLQRLRKEGVIALGGRFADTGLIVLRAADDAAARAMFVDDQTIAAKVFTLDVDPWSTIFEGCTTAGT